MTPQQYYLSFTSSGIVKFDRANGYEQFNSSIAKLVKWKIVNAKDSKNRDLVTPFDDIVLVSPFGQYLQVTDAVNFTVGTGNSKEPNDTCIFRIIKSNIPFLPDWLFKRPHLNHNMGLLPLQAIGSKQRPEDKVKPLGSFPIEIQETFLIEDLLYAMSGIEGVYIRRRQKQSPLDGMLGPVEFQVEPNLPNTTCDFSL